MRARRGEPSSRRLAALIASLALVIAVGACVGAAVGVGMQGSDALWNAGAPISRTEVRSGTLTATSAAFDAATWNGMLAGEARSATLTIGNTGSTPFLLAASLDATSAANPDVSWQLAPGSCAAAAGAPVALGQTPQNVGAPLLAGTFASYCLTVTLSSSVGSDAAGTTASVFSLLLDANQYRP